MFNGPKTRQHVGNYKPISILVLFLFLLSPFPVKAVVSEKTNIIKTFDVIKKQVTSSLKIVPVNRFPMQTDNTGKWQTTQASGWTSGFYPGVLWLLYEQSGNKSYAAEAVRREKYITAQQYNTSTHDVGFMIHNSFGNAYRLTKNVNDKKVILRAAQSLTARYNPKVGLIKSWDGDSKSFQVIIDNLMNLELLFWSAKNGGDPKLAEIAATHAKNTARDFIRKDGGTYHLVNYNISNGKRISRTTAQGYEPESTWSRGQAWAIYGFSIAYRETKDAAFLTAARKTADYYINNLPADYIPYWDFNVPKITTQPRDSSAAAIAASGLLELSLLENNSTRSSHYRKIAEETLASLSSKKYLASSGYGSVLLRGTYNKRDGEFDRGTIWGDYYFIEALLKLRRAP